MTLLRRSSLLAVPLLVAGAAAILPSGSAGAATTSASVEAERMTLLSGRVVYYSDSSASGGRAVSMTRNGTVSATLTTPQSQTLVLRLRGDQYQGAPQAVVRVDGRQVAALAVSATRWTDYTVKGSWTAGQHALQVSYVNDLSVSGVGDRNLRLDRATFVGATAIPTGTPTPTATTTPTATPTATTTPTATPTATTTPTSTPTATSSTPTSTSADVAYEGRIVELVNLERAKAGLRPLTVSPCADRYAHEWSASMAASGQLVHRSDLGAVMTACAARAIGENIAYGTVTADEMMAMWMGSTGHRANILNATYTHIGVGIARTSTGRVYGTQNFLTLG